MALKKLIYVNNDLIVINDTDKNTGEADADTVDVISSCIRQLGIYENLLKTIGGRSKTFYNGNTK